MANAIDKLFIEEYNYVISTVQTSLSCKNVLIKNMCKIMDI